MKYVAIAAIWIGVAIIGVFSIEPRMCIPVGLFALFATAALSGE